MKIALVLAPVWDASWPVLALPLLSAELKQHGHEVMIFDLNKEISLLSTGPATKYHPTADPIWSDADLLETQMIPAYEGALRSFLARLLAAKPALVGFSIFFSNWAMSSWLAREIKKREPGIAVVFGGSFLLKFSRCLRFVERPEIDAVVFGEADRSFTALADRLESSGVLEAAPGVLLRNNPATWQEEQILVPDLNELPYADYAGVPLERYQGKIIHTSRGCIRRCVYCQDTKVMRFRRMTGERIFSEIRYQLDQDPGVTDFFLGDSMLNSDMDSLSRFCDLVIENQVKIRWSGYAGVRPGMTPAFLEKMHRAGCASLKYGIETGSARLLADMGKPVTPELNGRVLQDSLRAGIHTSATMMVGFPTETEEHFRETLDFVRTFGDGIGAMGVSLFSIEELMGEWERYDLVPTTHVLYWKTRNGRNTYPIRLERLRSLFKACGESSVKIYFEGGADSSDMERVQDSLLSNYHRWLQSHPAESAP